MFSLAQRLLEHSLLIEHSPANDQRLLWAEVDQFRARMKRQLSPTIRRRLKAALGGLFAAARAPGARKMERHGEDQTAAALPAACPYTLEQILGDWLPDGAALGPP